MLSLLRAARRSSVAAPLLGAARSLGATAAAQHSHSHGGVPCAGDHDHGHAHSHTPFGPDGPDEAGTLDDGVDDDATLIPPAVPPSEDSCVRPPACALSSRGCHGGASRAAC